MTRRRFSSSTAVLVSTVALSLWSAAAFASGAAQAPPAATAPPPAAAPPAGAPAQAPVNVAGVWVGTVKMPDGKTSEVEATFTQSGADVKATTVNKANGNASSGEGTVSGNHLVLRGAGGRTATYVVNGDEMRSIDNRIPITMRRKP